MDAEIAGDAEEGSTHIGRRAAARRRRQPGARRGSAAGADAETSGRVGTPRRAGSGTKDSRSHTAGGAGRPAKKEKKKKKKDAPFWVGAKRKGA